MSLLPNSEKLYRKVNSWFTYDDSDQENVVQASVGIAEDDNSWSVVNIHPNVVIGRFSTVINVILIVLGIIACIFLRYRRGRDVVSVSSSRPPIVPSAPIAQNFPMVVYRQEGSHGSSYSGHTHPEVDDMTGHTVFVPEKCGKMENQGGKNSDKLFRLVTMLNQAG